MAQIPPEIVPTSADADILSFCQKLVPGAALVLVPIQPWHKAVPGECFHNVEMFVSEHGGNRILGWRPMRWANIMVEAEAHAVWQSPDGTLVDITPLEQSSSLFLPDPDMKYIGFGHANIRQALTTSPLVAEFIELSNQLDSVRISVKPGTPYSPPFNIFQRWTQINSILHTKGIGRNTPCPCQSGLKFKKCCGRFA